MPIQKLSVTLGEDTMNVSTLKIKDLVKLLPLISEQPKAFQEKGIVGLVESNLEIIALATGKTVESLLECQATVNEITEASRTIMRVAGLEVTDTGEPNPPMEETSQAS